MENRQFLKRILIIICLTILPNLVILPIVYKLSIGWILGSLASAVNFIWLFRQGHSLNLYDDKQSMKNSFVGFSLRYLFLIVYSVGVMFFLKPNIIMYGLGLFAAQLAIFINQGYEYIQHSTFGKYYRGDHEK